MTKYDMRSLSQDEICLVERLLAREMTGAELLRAQIEQSFVYALNDDGSILRFQVSPKAVPAKMPYKQASAGV